MASSKGKKKRSPRAKSSAVLRGKRIARKMRRDSRGRFVGKKR